MAKIQVKTRKTHLALLDADNKLGIQVCMDGRGCCLDNHWIERFWRTLKTEYLYLWPAESGIELKNGIDSYIDYYNNKRCHSGINNYAPEQYCNFTGYLKKLIPGLIMGSIIL